MTRCPVCAVPLKAVGSHQWSTLHRAAMKGHRLLAIGTRGENWRWECSCGAAGRHEGTKRAAWRDWAKHTRMGECAKGAARNLPAGVIRPAKQMALGV